MSAKPNSTGLPTLTPHLAVAGAAKAIEFYKKAFGAEEVHRFPGPDGKGIMHAHLTIGNSHLMLNDEFPQMGCRGPLALGGSPVTLNLSVDDCDAVFSRAVAAGATARMPPADMFWGDRYAQVTDPFGHVWAIAQRKENLTPEEMARRGKEAMAKMGAGSH